MAIFSNIMLKIYQARMRSSWRKRVLHFLSLIICVCSKRVLRQSTSAQTAFPPKKRIYWQRLVPPSRLQDVPEWEQEFGVSAELFDEFRTLKNTVMKNWHTEIFNYFNPDCRFTNAATEGLNNLIGRIDRQGAGYSFERLRQKVLLYHLAKPKTRYKSERKTVPVYEKQSIGRSTSTLGLVIPDTPKIIGYKEICEIVDISQCLYREPLSVFSYLPQDYIDP